MRRTPPIFALATAVALAALTLPRGARSDTVFTRSGPEGGEVRAFAADPTPGSITLYAGTLLGGVYKTTNGGATWKSAGGGLASTGVAALAVDPRSPATVYAGTDGLGFYKSTNGGATWTPSSGGGFERAYVAQIAVDPRSSDTVYAAGSDGDGSLTGLAGASLGFMKSADAGATWLRVGLGLPLSRPVRALAVQPAAPYAILASLEGGKVFASTNGGGTWTLADGGLDEAAVRAFSFSPTDPSRVSAATDDGIFHADIRNDVFPFAVVWSRTHVDLDFPRLFDSVLDTPAALYASGFDGVIRSTDRGTTWTYADGGLENPEVRHLGADAAGNVFAAAGGTGVFRSSDRGGSWTFASAGLIATDIQALAVAASPPSTTLYAGTTGGVSRSTDGGATWALASGGLAGLSVTGLALDPAAPSTVYAATPGSVLKATDGGRNWAFAGDGLSTRCTLAVAVDPAAPATVYVGTCGDGVFKSTDGARRWSPSGSGLANGFVRSLAVDPRTPSTVYAGTGGDGVFKSTDAGASWTPANDDGGGLLQRGDVKAIAIDPSTPSNVFLATPAGVFRSTNGGARWEQPGEGLTVNFKPLPASGIAVDPGRPSTVYAATTAGVYRSTDGAATWAPYSAGLTTLAVTTLAVDTNGVLFAGSQGNGVFRTSSGGVTATWIVPIVLDAPGRNGARFTSELMLANRGTTAASVQLFYQGAAALGDDSAGTVLETLAPGQQLLVPDVIGYLRARGAPLARGLPHAGSLRVSFGNLSSAGAAYAAARTTTPYGPGRAGLAYPGTPLEDLAASQVRLFGLRENATDRSNLALVNAGTNGAVTLRVTLHPANGGPAVVRAPDVSLEPGQLTQLSSVLDEAGLHEAYATVERIAGGEPFLAFATIVDNVTNDGSFVTAVPAGSGSEPQTLPVVVETPTFDSELVLANPGPTPASVSLTYVESLGSPRGLPLTVAESLGAGEQRILPGVIRYLRGKGAPVGPPGPSYAGTLSVAFTSAAADTMVDGFAGARTASPPAGAPRFGVFYPAVPRSSSAVTEAWVHGLRQDGSARSNLAVAHAGPPDSGDVALAVEVYDGETGRPAGSTDAVTLAPGGWYQLDSLLRRFGVANGYARVVRTAGDAPFIAYGVVNDGSDAGSGTNDGSFVAFELP